MYLSKKGFGLGVYNQSVTVRCTDTHTLNLSIPSPHPHSYIMHATPAWLLERKRECVFDRVCVCVFNRNMQHNRKRKGSLKWNFPTLLFHLFSCSHLSLFHTYTHTHTHIRTSISQSQLPLCPVAPPVSCCHFPVDPISGEHWKTDYGLKQCSIGRREVERDGEGDWEWGWGGRRGWVHLGITNVEQEVVGNRKWWWRRREWLRKSWETLKRKLRLIKIGGKSMGWQKTKKSYS